MSGDDDPELKSKIGPGWTTELASGHKESTSGWLRRTQNLLLIETIVYLYGKQLNKKAVALSHVTKYFEKAVAKVDVPKEHHGSRGKLLFALQSSTTLTPETIWNKAHSLVRELRNQPIYNELWLAIWPNNTPPSGQSNAKAAFERWWRFAYNLEQKTISMDEVPGIIRNGKEAKLDAPKKTWSGPNFAEVFEKYGMVANFGGFGWSIHEKELFDTRDATVELDKVEQEVVGRERRRKDELDRKGFVAQSAVFADVKTEIAVRDANSKARYVANRDYETELRVWEAKMQAHKEAAASARRDATEAEADGDNDEARALRREARKAEAQYRALCAQCPERTWFDEISTPK